MLAFGRIFPMTARQALALLRNQAGGESGSLRGEKADEFYITPTCKHGAYPVPKCSVPGQEERGNLQSKRLRQSSLARRWRVLRAAV
jgi:hypothetical protein